jgi:hypothetical protein
MDEPAPSNAPEDPLPSEPADEEFADDKELVARTSLARRRGDNDESGVKALLSRAARRHRAALDRLAR